MSRGGGLAAWAIRHPVSTLMLGLTVVVLGGFALGRLSVDLLPHLIYPQVRVRILDPGVSAAIMEHQVTRQLEEQLAITEDATRVESETAEGSSSVDLHFDYGKDIDAALRDASTRLDRAKRFLPETISPPIIYKMDPSQIPVMEFVISSGLRDTQALRQWVDDVFSKRFLNLPGVAAIEVGGGVEREIHVLPDQRRLAGLGLSVEDIVQAIQRGNEDVPAGRLRFSGQEYGGRAAGRLGSVGAIAALPIRLPGGDRVTLSEIARIIDTHEDERLRIRLNGEGGVKMSVQKQPTANTVDVATRVHARLAWLKANHLVPEDIKLSIVSDQAIYVRRSLTNAALAALSGALLAMLVVYLFLGNIRATLIIGSAIPISVMVSFVIMGMGGLSLNIMTLGGLALGVGMLIDNTIVMLENIARHRQQSPERAGVESAEDAAAEVTSAVVAATSTNLAAVLPFLFVSGLIGLLFRELIFTISAAIIASLVVALTLVPTLAARIRAERASRIHDVVTGALSRLQQFYTDRLALVLARPVQVIAAMVIVLILVMPVFFSKQQSFLPNMDEGRVSISVLTDAGTALDSMDATVKRIEHIAWQLGDVESIYTLVGGRVFGRTARETPSNSGIIVQLVPHSRRSISSENWIRQLYQALKREQLAGVQVRARSRGIRGLRTSTGEDDLSIRVQGADLKVLATIGDSIVKRLQGVPGLRNLKHSAEETQQEFAIEINRARAAELGVDVTDVGRALSIALEGIVVSDFIDADRSVPIRVRLPHAEVASPDALSSILLFGAQRERKAVYLSDVASIRLATVPAMIKRDNQRRIVEVSASMAADQSLGGVMDAIRARLADLPLPEGYYLYYGGADEALQQGQMLTQVLLGLALFLVFVVMAVQYESLRSPTVIMLSVPFALIGVALALLISRLPFFDTIALSMPVWLGIIMLVGIVVNNAIILVEYIELMRRRGMALVAAITEAARLRLRPILMTTLTTVIGMLPLALGIGEGAEMLRPLAVAIVGGLSFSMLVSLVLVPAMYLLFARAHERA